MALEYTVVYFTNAMALAMISKGVTPIK